MTTAFGRLSLVTAMIALLPALALAHITIAPNQSTAGCPVWSGLPEAKTLSQKPIRFA